MGGLQNYTILKVDSFFYFPSHNCKCRQSHTKVQGSGVSTTGITFAQSVKQGDALVANLCKREAQDVKEGCSCRGKDVRSVKQKEQAACIFPRSASNDKTIGF